MKNLHAYYRDVSERLGSLKDLISDAGRLKYFEESLAANELEVALHALCDFLLEPRTPAVSCAALRQIESLHTLMEIEDDCIKKLSEKGR